MVIYNLRLLHLPAFRFEWHPQVKTVYVIEIGKLVSGHEVAEAIAQDVRTQGDATNAALIWARGYRAGRSFRLDARSEENDGKHIAGC